MVLFVYTFKKPVQFLNVLKWISEITKNFITIGNYLYIYCYIFIGCYFPVIMIEFYVTCNNEMVRNTHWLTVVITGIC